jgi:hypothetical protein
MRNDKRPICIGPVGLRAVRARMHDGDLSHCNDVDVESAWAEPHCWHTAEESLKFFDAREDLNSCCGRLFWKNRAHPKRGVEELWLINKADGGGAIERRDLLKVPARYVRKRDDRFGERGDRVVKVGSDP